MSRRRISRYRNVDIRMHGDARFRSLPGPDPNPQTVFERLLTWGTDTSIPGLHALGLGGINDRLPDWPRKGVEMACAQLVDAGMIRADWVAGVIWLPTALSQPQNQPRAVNNLKHWGEHWGDIPECALKHEAWESAREWVAKKGAPWLVAFDEKCPEPDKGEAAPTRKTLTAPSERFGYVLTSRRGTKSGTKMGTKFPTKLPTEYATKFTTECAAEYGTPDPDPDPDLPLSPPEGGACVSAPPSNPDPAPVHAPLEVTDRQPGGAPSATPVIEAKTDDGISADPPVSEHPTADAVDLAINAARAPRTRAKDPHLGADQLRLAASHARQDAASGRAPPAVADAFDALADLRAAFEGKWFVASMARTYVRRLVELDVAPEDLRRAVTRCRVAWAAERRETVPPLAKLESFIAQERGRYTTPRAASPPPASGPDTADPRWFEVQRQCKAEGVQLDRLHGEVMKRLAVTRTTGVA